MPAAKAGLHPQNPVTYQEAFASYHDEQNKLVTAEIIDLADLNRLSGQNISLGDHQILAFDSRFSNGQKLNERRYERNVRSRSCRFRAAGLRLRIAF